MGIAPSPWKEILDSIAGWIDVHLATSCPPGALLRLMSADKKKFLFANTARAIGGAPREIQIRHIGNCLKADPAYGKGVADALGIPLSEVPKKG
jgi:catalase